jgi:hypothetical protein
MRTPSIVVHMLRMCCPGMRTHAACGRDIPGSSDQEDCGLPVNSISMALWRLVGWLLFALVHRRVALAGDVDRERAAARLREG